MSTPYKRRRCSPVLPEDVVLEILQRLPVKTLLRFKCVCKRWNAVIASQSFAKQHYAHGSNKERLLISREDPITHQRAYSLLADDTFSSFEEPPHLQFPGTVWKVMGAVNGVFCLVGQLSGDLALLNPATRQLKQLPKRRHDGLFELSEHVLKGVFGFGLDPLSGDIKVVVIRSLPGETGDVPVSVYNSRSDSWKNVASFESCYLERISASYGQYCDGVYYWVLTILGSTDVTGLLAFNVSTEKFEEIRVPDCIKSKPKVGLLAIHSDSIALLTLEFKTVAIYDVWVMEKKSSSWYRVATCCPFQPIRLPVCLWKNNELVFQSSDYFTLYNIRTEKIRCPLDRFRQLADFFPYKESLVSIKGNGDNCTLWDVSADIW